MTNTSWDERYCQDGDRIRQPASFLAAQLNLLPRGRALDIATGSGRNAIFLSRNGYQVDAVDSSTVAVERVRSLASREALPIAVTCADLTAYSIAENFYDLILNFYFLERKLFEPIKMGLRQGGVLLFETYTLEQARYGRPRNPEFLLKPNELLRSFSDLHIIYYHERIEQSDHETRALASLVAQKR